MTNHMCCETFATAGMAFYRSKPCGKKAKVEVDGLHYCGVHDPIKVAAKRVERTAKWDAKRASKRKELALSSAAPMLLDALIDCLDCEFPVTDKAVIAKARAAIAKAEG